MKARVILAVLATLFLGWELADARAEAAIDGLVIGVNAKCLTRGLRGSVLLSVKATPILCADERDCRQYEQAKAIKVSDFNKTKFSTEITVSLDKLKEMIGTEPHNTLLSVNLCEQKGKEESCGSPQLQQVFKMKGNQFEQTYGRGDVSIKITNDVRSDAACPRS